MIKAASKVLAISTILASTLFANSAMDKNVIDFEKKRYSTNKNVEIQNVTVFLKKELPVKNWYGYILNIEAKVQGKMINVKDMVFTDGVAIAPELLNMKTLKSYKSLMVAKLSNDYYNKDNLIVGNENAKNKLVIFSDPLCPFCIDYVPEVIKYVKKNNKDLALYYYHFPLLRIHPAADALTKLMDIAKHKGVKDVELKVYETDWDKHFNEREKDSQKILNAFNKELGLNITMAELNNPKVKQDILDDVAKGDNAIVRGTPTIFVNGELDRTKRLYESLGK